MTARVQRPYLDSASRDSGYANCGKAEPVAAMLAIMRGSVLFAALRSFTRPVKGLASPEEAESCLRDFVKQMVVGGTENVLRRLRRSSLRKSSVRKQRRGE